MADLPERLQRVLTSRYRIERELGRGGMATVYLAQDLKHDRLVAMKVLDPEASAAIGRERFLREVKTVARLTHPHIVPLHDSGEADGLLFYVMPYVEGESLRARLEREKQLPVEDALRIALEVADALSYAHGRGVVHRDIKPENVLLEEGHAVLADFGIARAVTAAGGEKPTATGVVVGTPTYMSPEQMAGGRDLDGRTDLYSFGCVLYEMLAGQPPFTGPNAESILYQHLSVAPRPVTELRPSVPSLVAAALEKALAKLPADRYATVARFAESLALAATDRSVPKSPAATGHGNADTPTNLPQPRTRFIGRERELGDAAAALSEARLLTFTGVGGGGKTRLALELATRVLPAYPDGVWFVDLGPLAEAGRVAQAVAATLGVAEEPGVPIAESLARRVSAKQALIVLDNCEHLLDAGAAVAEVLLNAGPKLRLIATSRESLGVEGERPFNVRSLSVPGLDLGDVAAIGATEAVSLFVDRAQRVVPEFSLGLGSARSVAEICRRLDGIPLAIELAAARVELLSVEQIREKLDDRFGLLTGSRRALPRHQTLRAAMQWSYDLLTPDAQRLVRRLAVFAGGWTLAGAVAVAGEGIGEFEVLECLTDLVHKSLVQVEREEAVEPRYSMLETVRQFAAERLRESGEGDEARTRHLDFYVALSEEAWSRLQGPDQGEWLRRLDRELDNLLAAHGWCDRAEGGGEKGMRLVSAVGAFWDDRGHYELGLRLHREALSRPGARGGSRAKALLNAGFLAIRRGLHSEARGYGEEGFTLARDLGDDRQIASALNFLGSVEQEAGHPAAARALKEQGLALARALGDARILAGALNNLGPTYEALGELEAAKSAFEEALALYRQRGTLRGVGIGLANLAEVEIMRGRLESARVLLRECLECMDRLGSTRLGADVTEVAAGLAAAGGEWERAARIHGATDAAFEKLGVMREWAEKGFLRPFLERAKRELDEDAYASAYALGRALGATEALAEVRSWLESGEPPPPDRR